MKKTALIILLLAIFVHNVSAQIVYTSRDKSEAACVSASAKAHFALNPEDNGFSQDLLLVVTQDNEELKQLLPLPLPYPTMFYTIEGDSLPLPRLDFEVDAILVSLNDSKLLKQVLKSNELRWSLNTRLLVVLKDMKNASQAANATLRYAWKVGIPYVTVVTVGPRNEGEMSIYGWQECKEHFCKCKPPQIFKYFACPLHSSTAEFITFFKSWPQFFLEPRPNQEISCNVHVVMLQTQPNVILPENDSHADSISDQTDGVEVRLVKTIGHILKFRPEFYTPEDGMEWGRVFSNGSGNGLMGELTCGKAEIGIGSIMPLPQRTQVTHMSRTHYQSYLSWAVPLPRSPSLWSSLVAPFSAKTWMAILVTLLLAIIISLGISKKYPVPGGAILFSWCTMLGSSLSRLPLLTWQRIMLCSWLIACLILSAAYQGGLFSALTSPRHQWAPNTLQELISAEMPLGGHPGFLQLILDEGKNDEAVRHSYRPLQHVLSVLDEVARGERNVALVVNKDILRWYNAKHKTDGQTVHIAREDITTYPTVTFLRKNSPFRSRYDNLVTLISEAGLISKWHQDLAEPLTTRMSRPIQGPKALSMSQLAAAFWCLVVGLTLAFAVFTLENLVILTSRHNAIKQRHRS